MSEVLVTVTGLKKGEDDGDILSLPLRERPLRVPMTTRGEVECMAIRVKSRPADDFVRKALNFRAVGQEDDRNVVHMVLEDGARFGLYARRRWQSINSGIVTPLFEGFCLKQTGKGDDVDVSPLGDTEWLHELPERRQNTVKRMVTRCMDLVFEHAGFYKEI